MININSKVPIIGIYKITSPSGKVYVGQSTNIYKRWKIYKRLSCSRQTYIYNSLQKYGVDNHVFEIIEECNVEQLDEREIYWAKQHNALYPCGLVLKIGSKRGYMSEESKQKMRKPKSKIHSNNISLGKKGIPNVLNRKPILQYDKQMTLINEWSSIKEAALNINKNYNSCKSSIQAVCSKKRQKSAFGYIWRYKEN